jgi:oxygen-independent coproporphyrinogen-3 oxidase
MSSICEQFKHEIKQFNIQKHSLETLFIGGGTPSCVSATLYEPFFTLIKPYLKQNAEITTEANPNSATKKWLFEMNSLGVNRVSFGTQSFDEKKLLLLGRNHTSKDTKKAVLDARDVGFKNISLDLIYGVLGDTKELLLYDINQAFKLPINHISAYSLTIEEGTKFYTTPNMSDDNEKLAEFVCNKITSKGFPQYEISNFGTYNSLHNLGYWQYKNYIGIGSGAVGFLKNRRFYTEKNVQQYINNPLKTEIEYLTTKEIKEEKILLGLRSIVGFDRNLLDSNELKKTDELTKERKLISKNQRFYNPNFLLSDAIALYILS